MQHKVKLIAAFMTLLGFTFSSFITKPGGGDSYRILLNGNLLMKQHVNEPLSLKSLQLTKANVNDELVIYYSHCGQTGKARKITIKDENGTNIREWKFADVSGDDTGMKIAVRDLLQLEKKYAANQLNIVYSSQQLPQGRMLTGVKLTDRSTTAVDSYEIMPALAVE